MLRFSKKEFESLLTVKVVDILAYYGKRVDLSCAGMCHSPFRDEDEPSFHISPSGTAWMDFGNGEGGGVIDLVCRLGRVSKGNALDVLRTIRDRSGAPVPYSYNETDPEAESGCLKIIDIRPLSSSNLVRYLYARGIPQKVAGRYCCELDATVGKSDRVRHYVAFPTNDDGYVLRSGGTVLSKLCTRCAPTFLAPNGCPSDNPSSEGVLVFEGFMDFLSYVVLCSRKGAGQLYDACVLNSIVNLKKSEDFIKGHKLIYAFLDNDAAGRSTTAKLEAMASEAGAEFVDRSCGYADFKDLNDFLRETRGLGRTSSKKA